MPYTPHPKQREMHLSKARVKWVQAGRRGGKTRGALQEDLRKIDQIARLPVSMAGKRMTAEDAGLVPAIHCWTVAPTKAQMRQVWNEMRAFIPQERISRRNPYGEQVATGGRGGGFKEDDLYVWLTYADAQGRVPRGIYRPHIFWELKSADNAESLQSVGLDFLHVTEAQDIKEAAWNKLAPTLRSAGRLGYALVEGIPPQSPQHWFARNFQRAFKAPNKNRAGFRWSAFDNPLLTEAQKESIYEDREVMLEEDWARLYLAEQPEGHGAFFQNVSEAASGEELAGPQEGRSYVGGLDIGRTNDPTVLVVKDRESRASVAAVEMRRTDWNLQLETIKHFSMYWNLQEIVLDVTGLGGKIAQDALHLELVEQSIPIVAFNFTPQKKYQLFLEYALALQHKTVTFPREWDKLVSQLLDMSHTETMNRGHVFKTVSGGHDDWVDAEALALYACEPAENVNGEVVSSQLLVPIPSYAPLREDGSGARYGSGGILRAIKMRRSMERVRASGMPLEAIINGEEIRSPVPEEAEVGTP